MPKEERAYHPSELIMDHVTRIKGLEDTVELHEIVIKSHTDTLQALNASLAQVVGNLSALKWIGVGMAAAVLLHEFGLGELVKHFIKGVTL